MTTETFVFYPEGQEGASRSETFRADNAEHQ
jgi:hypothetical protein